MTPLAWAAALGLALAPAGGDDEAVPPRAAAETVVILASSGHAAYQAAAGSARGALLSAMPESRAVGVTLRADADPEALREILAASPSLVVTIGSRAAMLAREGLSGIPLVYAMVLDPASLGLPAPGQATAGSMTGVSLDVPIEDQLDLIRTVLPDARRIGVLYDPSASGGAVRRAEAAARSRGYRLVAQSVRSEAAALEAARLLAPSVDAVLAIADPTVLTSANTRPLILLWLREGKPLFAMSEGFVRNGAIAALVPDPDEVGRRAGELAVRILRGASPSSVGPEPPPLVSIFLNRASAEHLGVSLPESVVTRAKAIFPE